MTRDEAVQIMVETWGGCSDALGLMVALERIGAVQFEPSRKVEKRAIAAIQNRFGVSNNDVLALLADFQSRGLKIVEA